jgi:hypothetical protein
MLRDYCHASYVGCTTGGLFTNIIITITLIAVTQLAEPRQPFINGNCNVPRCGNNGRCDDAHHQISSALFGGIVDGHSNLFFRSEALHTACFFLLMLEHCTLSV